MTRREPLSKGPVSHRAINACIAPIASLADSAITTVEALGSVRDGVHPVVRACAGIHRTPSAYARAAAARAHRHLQWLAVRLLHAWHRHVPVRVAGRAARTHAPAGANDALRMYFRYSKLRESPAATVADIEDCMDGNLCRCESTLGIRSRAAPTRPRR